MYRRKKGIGREEILRIISFCLSVEKKGSDPFEVQVRRALDTIRKYLPEWGNLEEFNLDAEALNRISTIIQLQGKWLKHQSSSLYVDPLLIELKIKMIDPKRFIDIFRNSFHPIVELERLSPKRLTEAVEYWNKLLPIEERWKEIDSPNPTETLPTSIEELLKSNLLSGNTFHEKLDTFWKELKDRSGDEGKISYWDFILEDTYKETVARAYLTSFLVTYGYATLEINPVEEETFLVPYNKPSFEINNNQSVSIPIPIDYNTWKSMRR